MDRSAFLSAIKRAFPELRADLNRQQGIMGFEVQVLRKAADRAIYDCDTQRLAVLAGLAEAGLVQGNRQVRAAVLAFFVDDLDVVGRHAWALASLPPIVAAERRRRMTERGVPRSPEA